MFHLKFQSKKFLSLALALVLIAGSVLPAFALTGTTPPAAALPHLSQQPAAAAPVLQFQSGGHALGFAPDKIVVSNGTYALRVEFVDAQAVSPQAANSAAATAGAAPPLSRVTYPNLWPGITLAYDAGGGLARSAYTLAPGANPTAIRLRYNAPVTVEADGSLQIAYETGVMSESAPLAWQEIDGGRVAVDVAFQTFQTAEVSQTSAVSTVGFRLGRYDPRYPLTIDPTLTWNTFLGGSGDDRGGDIAVDGSGNVYVAGQSDAAWGSSPKRAHSGGSDVFAAKLDSNGSLVWHTFLGGSGDDYGKTIAVDSSGSVYVAGDSSAAWSCSPTACTVRAYTTGYNTFAAKLDSNGNLAWNTFLGVSGGGGGLGEAAIAVDSSSVYVAGTSGAAWSCSPTCTKRAFTGGDDAFAAKLNSSNGSLTWNTFLGGSTYYNDFGSAIAVDGSGNVYVAGNSAEPWLEVPVRAFTGSSDAFAAKLGSNGSLTWHTFLGGSGLDQGNGIAVDGSGNVYVAGISAAAWGSSPVRAYTAGDDAFAAKLGSNGSLTWHTFLGGSTTDRGNAIAVDGSGSVYVTGYSGNAAWSCSPVACTARPYSGTDAFAARLGSNGSLTWNTFLGGYSTDQGNGIAVDGSGSVYVAGWSVGGWSCSPTACTVRPHYGSGVDAFAAKLVNLPPVAAAGSDQAVLVGASVSLNGGGSTDSDNLPLTYGWKQTGGPAVTFTPTLSRPTFTAPITLTVLTFTLVVTSSSGLVSTPDETVVNVNVGTYLPLIIK